MPTCRALLFSISAFLSALASSCSEGAGGPGELTVGASSSSQTIDEGGGSVEVRVELSRESGSDVRVPFRVGGTASALEDHRIDPSPLVIPAGERFGTIVVTLLDDDLDEDDETVEIALDAPSAGTLGDASLHVVTILDDDPLPEVELTDAAATVSEDVGSIEITLTLSTVSGRDVFVPFATGGTAVAAEPSARWNSRRSGRALQYQLRRFR